MPSFLDQQHLHTLLLDAVRSGVWLLIFAAIFLPFERLFPLHKRTIRQKIRGADLGYYLINSFIPALLLAAPISLVAWAAYQIVPHGLHTAVAAWPLWLRVVAGLVIGEIGSYWGHRWMHEVPFLWRFHSVHHSAEYLYFLTSARSHPLDNAFVRFCGLVPVYILGLASPLTLSGNLTFFLIALVAGMWGFFIHANVRWRFGPLEWLVTTPAFHHWHHTLHQPRDRNYASLLPWIDRIFGTHYLPPKEMPTAYGIEANMPGSLGGQLLHPLLSPQASLPEAGLPDAATGNPQ